MLKFNEETKVVFDNDDAAVEPVREITREEIPDLIANGATVDASANDLGKSDSSDGVTDVVAKDVSDPVAPAIVSDTAEQGNALAPLPLTPSGIDAESNSKSSDSAVTPALSFEERVEKRFLELEAAFMQLPHSIATVMSRGSQEPEEFAKSVIAHLFGRE